MGMMEAFVMHKESATACGFNARLVASTDRLIVLGKTTDVYQTYGAHPWDTFSGVQLGLGGQTFRLACASATYEVRSGNEYSNDGFITILSRIRALAKTRLIRTDVKLGEYLPPV